MTLDCFVCIYLHVDKRLIIVAVRLADNQFEDLIVVIPHDAIEGIQNGLGVVVYVTRWIVPLGRLGPLNAAHYDYVERPLGLLELLAILGYQFLHLLLKCTVSGKIVGPVLRDSRPRSGDRIDLKDVHH
jgi:hypothetical protein